MATKKIMMDFTGASIDPSGSIRYLHGDGCEQTLDGIPLALAVGGPMSNTNALIDQSMGHNAIPSLKLEDVLAGSARAELNLVNMSAVVGNEYFCSAWYYLPADWVVASGWYSLLTPMQGGLSRNWKPMIEIWMHQDVNGNITLTVGGQNLAGYQVKYLNKDGTYGEKTYTPSEFPRGRWFNIVWWMRRNPTLGESFIKLWFDGAIICGQTAFPYESGPLNNVQREDSPMSGVWSPLPANVELTDLDSAYPYFTTLAKIYHGSSSYIHQLWVDDIEIWDSLPIPTHNLTVNTMPVSGVPHTIDGTSVTSPWSGTLNEGNYTIVMPSNILVGADTYNFKQWEDLSTNPTRTINLVSDMSIIATYEIVVPPPAKGQIQVHAFFNTQEVAASGRIVETEETFTAPATVQVDPGTYTIELTYLGQKKTYSVTVAEGQTVRVDAQLAIPIPPIKVMVNLVGPIILGSLLLFSSKRG